jgi:predicted NBD/HSP70 family sugar kinase
MSMPRAVRHINEIRLLDRLYRQGNATRADLSRELDLMRSTVGNLVAGLVAQGLLSEGETVDPAGGGRAGRPGQLVGLHARHQAFLGADIGVGHLSVVAVDLLGDVVHTRTVTCTPVFGDVDSTLDLLAAMVREALAALPAEQTVQGICVTVPGLVDRAGVVLRAPVLGWSTVPVQQMLADRLGWTGLITSENDANAFAAAELHGRAPQASADALFVYLDAGVGGGMTSQGKLVRGHRGYAGEIGHIHLGEHGFDPHTAVQGSFESYVARHAVLTRFAEHGGHGAQWQDFLAALDAQTPAALHTLTEWGWWMGRGLAALISVLDPGRVVLGGPVAALFTRAEQEVIASVRQHLVPPVHLPVLAVSGLGVDACALGGAMLLHHAHLSIDQRLVFGAG